MTAETDARTLEQRTADLDSRISITFDEDRDIWRLQLAQFDQTTIQIDREVASDPVSGRVSQMDVHQFKKDVIVIERVHLLPGIIKVRIQRKLEAAFTQYKPRITRRTSQLNAVDLQIADAKHRSE